MRLTKFPAALLAANAILALAPAALADGKISEKGFNCAGGTDTGNSPGCQSTARDAAKYQFSYALINKAAYVLEHVILRATLNDGSSDWVQVRKHSENMKEQEGVTFSFDDAWIASELNIDIASLEDTGFAIRGEIRSTWNGGGRKQTNCPIVELNYNNSKWRYNREDDNTTYPADSAHVFMWKSSGTAGHVECKVASES